MKNKNNTIVNKLNDSYLSFDRIFAALISSVMVAYIVQMMNNKEFFDLQTYYSSINFAIFWVITFSSFAVLCFLTFTYKYKRLIPYTLLVTTTLLTCQLAAAYTNIDGGTLQDKPIDGDPFFLIGLALVDLIIIMWLTQNDKLQLKKINISHKTCLIVAAILFVATTVYFGYMTSLKYYGFRNYTFDFGIFTQMFENMATTGLPLTTVERSVEMSHFGVHFSPIFYLFLPGYMVFRSPVYLFYSQAACVAAGVFAIYLICKKLGLSGKVTLCFEFIYCFYPCLFNGCFYDFHENKILTTIILFLFYFIISDKRIPIIVFSLLLLMVKEDAAIYLIVIALYVLIGRKKYANGAIMLLMAIVYFVVANSVVSALGTEGVMMSRLNDYFVNGEQTYTAVLKSIFFDIGYLIKMMFTSDKLPFVIWMLLPVAFSPFMTKKLSTLILLLPIVPINLMQSWRYQYDINYQYTYGVAALIIFVAIISIKELKTRPRHIALLMSVIMCVAMSANLISPKITNNKINDNNYGKDYEIIQQSLEEIESDATVTADNSIVPHLYFVKQLYTIPEHYEENKTIGKTEYYVTDTRDKENEQELLNIMGNDYELIKSVSFVNIYQQK